MSPIEPRRFCNSVLSQYLECVTQACGRTIKM
ncbi:hypothetical protein B6A09_1340 [Saccharomyces cerevisiae synthetic construct]|uniref:Putative uncharacterized protein YBR141W-A n=2 Tax=Saccharomyces cerevisiae TaxID=4932 RepID=YB141_YEAST|nr:RecName: Full=Putative uncharacterized protein YBR141W-A [Saccharomyces cerevisiae S288C]AAL79247.1 unknown [Saccharomyces cerevisiae]ARB01943.1 hypothetical protein B6A09_1340 [Saccharomyces cerevisiae synthetic construct]CBK39216.1 EC1118_1B15_2982p [Saccharomyces cerevisiae EC1118]KZV13222.1 hypothetical protein WN66_00410 [Saccharomyces cerevisiae]WNV72039.1 hypothetical protein O6U65_0283 [Saccharomyces cerevisiae synthetic construct]